MYYFFPVGIPNRNRKNRSTAIIPDLNNSPRRVTKEIKEHIILNCSSNSLRRRILRKTYDLANLWKVGRSLEISESQATNVEKSETTISSIHENNKTNNKRRHQPRQNHSSHAKGESNFQRQHARSYRKDIQHWNGKLNTCRNCVGQYPL